VRSQPVNAGQLRTRESLQPRLARDTETARMPYAVARHHTGPRIAPARALGRPVSKLLANGVAETTVYDDAGRPTVRSHSQAGGLVLARYTATYDAAGNRLRVEELDGTFEYGYDASNQLISERRSGASAYAISYTYDAVGNRLAVDQSGAAARSGWLGRSEYAYNAADEL